MQTLVLTPWMSPESVVSWQRALCLFFLDKVEIVEDWGVAIRSPGFSINAPAVVRKKKPHKRARTVPFSRLGVFARDGFRCQYCGSRFAERDLSLDHLVPRSRGGLTVWENIVTSCRPCNARKGDKTPVEAGLRLLSSPTRPRAVPLEALSGRRGVPDLWRRYT